jgi:hypothetical protein
MEKADREGGIHTRMTDKLLSANKHQLLLRSLDRKCRRHAIQLLLPPYTPRDDLSVH